MVLKMTFSPKFTVFLQIIFVDELLLEGPIITKY